MSDQERNGSPSSTWRTTLQRILTKVSHGSAPFITTFVFIHLSAPILANLGGSSLSSRVMLLGREYYQTPFGEKFLLIAPLIVHPMASIAKRYLSPRPARRLTSVLSLTGYSAMIFTAIHFMTHRYFPSNPSPPIFAVSPSELDYEFVKVALHGWPWRSWLGYIGLTAVVAWHAAEGEGIIWNTWLRGLFGKWKGSARTAAIMAAAVVLSVASGLLVLSREPVMALSSTISRFRASLLSSPVYRY